MSLKCVVKYIFWSPDLKIFLWLDCCAFYFSWLSVFTWAFLDFSSSLKLNYWMFSFIISTISTKETDKCIFQNWINSPLSFSKKFSSVISSIMSLYIIYVTMFLSIVFFVAFSFSYQVLFILCIQRPHWDNCYTKNSYHAFQLQSDFHKHYLIQDS